ncbi:DUF4037 domain-containing protein [Sanguibacter antarcticus]|uniref:Tetratricopeptide (TPR) repeat protein n=1 Tax=Sanguibacter antarcticus TaxID=372484 RepID=A0A2A9E3S6_9MICO|nr:DUF4037 domain-containing protein [Sanguibacter antarcticus]PFG33221.1 tetratricopeptide (TPR) repeat protein [Sanguibacter antarcticus]
MPTPDPRAFDLDALLRELDGIFAAHEGATRAEPLLLTGLAEADELHDAGARLTLLNELIGFYRSQSRHDHAAETSDRALVLAESMGIVGTDAHASTLINAATALRAGGRYERALGLYRQALVASEATMAPSDRRLAALHNNLSILFSEMQDQPQAAAELDAALAILEASSHDPARDMDIATTCTNLVLVHFSMGQKDAAAACVERSLAIFRAGGHEDDAHYASAVAGHAEACYRMGRLTDAEALYQRALEIIAACYGTTNDYYAVTAGNLAEVQADLHAAGLTPVTPSVGRVPAAPAEPAAPPVTGLALAREYWETYGKPMLARYPHHRARIAVGLVGHGSECYGFDDEISRDHDFGPGFCLWLTAEDHAAIGDELQADYEALPAELRGVGPRRTTSRARGAQRRVGVFEIGDFFDGLTGYRAAPAADRVHEWLLLDEATLAAATNGAVFADPFGAFGAARGGFLRMPRDVQLALVSRRLGMVAQAGQYNVPRMLARADGEAAWLALAEFTRATASLVFLLNGPASAGYLPYYKWQFAALRALGARMGSRLPEVCTDLSELARLSSTACFGAGPGGTGALAAQERVYVFVEQICRQVVIELQARGLTVSDESFLERQRPFVDAHIDDAWLKSL